MKTEREVVGEAEVIVGAEAEVNWPEPQSEWGAELSALMKAVDVSGIPKLTVDEIEAYLERPLGTVHSNQTTMRATTSASL